LRRTVGRVLTAYLDQFPAVPVTLPWEDPRRGEPVTVRLLFTTPRGKALDRNLFNKDSWHPALIGAGIEPTRATGMHALRHFFASALLDAGESIKAIAEWLGHADPAFTLRVYTHLMVSSQGRARRAIDELFDGPNGLDGPGTAQKGR
jgi:integrase